MFHIALASTPKRVFALSGDSYHVHNEKFISALRGHDLKVYRSKSEIISKTFSNAAFHSGFTVDFEEEGRVLTRIRR